MSFTNINDPAGVKALLEQLRSSQAWQDVAATPEQGVPEPVTAATQPGSSLGLAPSTTAGSVASLLSQLQSSPSWSLSGPLPSNDPPMEEQAGTPSVPVAEPSPPKFASTPSYARQQDLKSYTFQQALPQLAQLSEDPAFVATIAELKRDQDHLERQLWEERIAIRTKYEEKATVARTKANMIGATLSKHEADMMSNAFKKELQKFDLERVLPAWDGLVSSQQTALASRGVPTMFSTSVTADRERQQRVIQVLEGIAG